jgi:DNA polymerase-3 subunit beta
MFLKISADLLGAALARLSSIPPTKPVAPALGCFRLRVSGSTLTVTATDLDVWGEVYTHDIEGQDGTVVVNAQLLLSLVRAQSGAQLVVKTHHGKLEVAGKATAQIPMMHHDDYPLVPVATDISGSIEPARLVAAIREAGYAQGTDSARPNLSGVYVGKERVVATDGHRCVALDLPGALPTGGLDGVLIPGPLAGLIEKNFPKRTNADVCVNRQHLIISTMDMTFGGRLVDMGFPDVSQVIPKDQPQYSVNKAEFAEAVKLAGLVKPMADKVDLRFGSLPGHLGLHAESSENGELRRTIDMTLLGEHGAKRVCVNWRYVAEALAHIPEDTVEVCVTGDLSPLILTGRAGSIHIIMPMRG